MRATYDVLRHSASRTEVRRARFDEDGGRWRLTRPTAATSRPTCWYAATGQLNRPSRSRRSPASTRFAGPSSTPRSWDHDHDLTGERVAVIGTGASAIQFVPAIAPSGRP